MGHLISVSRFVPQHTAQISCSRAGQALRLRRRRHSGHVLGFIIPAGKLIIRSQICDLAKLTRRDSCLGGTALLMRRRALANPKGVRNALIATVASDRYVKVRTPGNLSSMAVVAGLRRSGTSAIGFDNFP